MKNIESCWRWLASCSLAIVLLFNVGSHVIEHLHYEEKPSHGINLVSTKQQEKNKINKQLLTSTAIVVKKPEITTAFRSKRAEPVYPPVSYRIWLYSKLYQTDYLALSPLVNDNNHQREREGINDVWNNRNIIF
jgi:hypothetical protein